jgi:hypothetical protein
MPGINDGNSKSQITNSKQFPMTEIPNYKKFWLFGNWKLGFIWDLDIGIWDLGRSLRFIVRDS